LQIGYLVCQPNQKMAQLLRLILRDPSKKYIVYFSTCAVVDYFSRVGYELIRYSDIHDINTMFVQLLSRLPRLKNIPLFALHGKQDPKKRTGK
jgi:ATP-dependent RNA helicase DDX55/SPB4